MIFQYTVDSVLDGAKTQTRRCVKDGCFSDTVGKLHSVYHADGRLKWEVGKTYSVQPGRGKKGVGRIRITGIRGERVRDITEGDAQAEGCTPNLSALGFEYSLSARDAFAVIWDNIQPAGRRWADNPLVWVIEFELVKDSE